MTTATCSPRGIFTWIWVTTNVPVRATDQEQGPDPVALAVRHVTLSPSTGAELFPSHWQSDLTEVLLRKAMSPKNIMQFRQVSTMVTQSKRDILIFHALKLMLSFTLTLETAFLLIIQLVQEKEGRRDK